MASMIRTESRENSEVNLMSEVYKLADAGASVIQIKTRETIRSALVLRKSILTSDEEHEYKEWDIINGWRTFTKENFKDNRLDGKEHKGDFGSAIMRPLVDLRTQSSAINAHPDKMHYYVFVDPTPYMAMPTVTALVQQYAAILPTTNACIIFITQDIQLQDVPLGTLLVSSMKTPSSEELQEVLERVIENAVAGFEGGSELDAEDMRRISLLGLGLTLYEFETYAAIAIIEASLRKEEAITAEIVSEGIAKGKTSVVKQSDVLELLAPTNMSNVGGMRRLKDWIAERRSCYTEEAKEFGIEAPKGVVTVGVPGTGKSLIAGATASELGIPLVRFDIARVFSKYVGDSESRVSAALRMVESMAPCVLFIDEIDKAMGGAGGGGDSGTSSRVLGTLLTWLQDCKEPVFVIVTANNIDNLPPELLRRGRFDEIFSVGLPSKKERMEVLEIHLRKRGHEMQFTKQELNSFLEKSDTFVPAEIESAVKASLIHAFNENPEEPQLEMRHILSVLEGMVPMARAYEEKIDKIIKWAKSNATPVNYPEDTNLPIGVDELPEQQTHRAARTLARRRK